MSGEASEPGVLSGQDEPFSGVRELVLGGVSTSPLSVRVVNLRDLGFDGRVSDEARAEIDAAQRRAMRVLTTAHLYWFGGNVS